MMIKVTSRVFLAVAAASLAVAPMAAQANTRAADSDVCYVCSAAQSSGDVDTADRFMRGRGFGGLRALRLILGVAAFSALVAAIVAASEQGNQSPGT